MVGYGVTPASGACSVAPPRENLVTPENAVALLLPLKESVTGRLYAGFVDNAEIKILNGILVFHAKKAC